MKYNDLQLKFCPYCGTEVKTKYYCENCQQSFQVLTEYGSLLPEILSKIKWDESATDYQKQIILEILSEFVKVDGGSFTMGVTQYKGCKLEGYQKDWQTPHRVTLTPFFISKFLVTQRQWFAFMPTHACRNIGEELPVDSVSWNDCITFCEKLKNLSGIDFSLPTEAQWFWVAKECDDFRPSETEHIEEYAWTESQCDCSRRPGLKKPNKLGIYDLLGNLYEWCLDAWGSWKNIPVTNPYREGRGNMIRKGGSWWQMKPDIFDEYNINARDFRATSANMDDSGIRLAIFNPENLNKF